MGTLHRRRRILDRLPDVECTGACADQACRDLTVSQLDVDAIKVAYGLDLETATDGRHCSLLRDGKCAAHDERPFICRTYGAHELLPCPYGCTKPALSTETTISVFRELAALDPRASTYQRIGRAPDPVLTAAVLQRLPGPSSTTPGA